MRIFRRLNFQPFLISNLELMCVLTILILGCTSVTNNMVKSQDLTPTPSDSVTPSPSQATKATITPIPTFDGPIEKVRVGTFGLSSDAAIFIAMERGYFKEQGIEIETSQFTALSDMIPALATGQLDVGNANVGAALFNALGSEFGLKIVADNATIEFNNDGSALVLRPELIDGIKSPADLKGLNIAAVANKGTPAQICIDKLLALVKLSTDDLTMVQLPFPAMAAALTNGAVDGAMIVEPFLSSGLSKGIFVIYKGAGEMCPGDEVNVQVYSPNFAGRTDLAQRFAIARLKGARDFNDAFFKNIDRDALVAILSEYTALKDPALYADVRFTTMNPDGKVNIDSLNSYLAWFVERGFVKQMFDINDAIDTSFSENAVEVLGSYQ